MNPAVVGQAVAMFAVTNIDDIVMLALFFSQATDRGGTVRVVAGQYLGFVGILAAAVAGTLGAGLLPETVIPYLGLLPLLLGIRAGWRVWSGRSDGEEGDDRPLGARNGGPTALTVATVTFANGGDNIGVYVPVFATTDRAGLVTYIVVFLGMVAVWCALGRYFATRQPIAKALSRRGHILLPVVLIGIGLLILVEGGAFGL